MAYDNKQHTNLIHKTIIGISKALGRSSPHSTFSVYAYAIPKDRHGAGGALARLIAQSGNTSWKRICRVPARRSAPVRQVRGSSPSKTSETNNCGIASDDLKSFQTGTGAGRTTQVDSNY